MLNLDPKSPYSLMSFFFNEDNLGETYEKLIAKSHLNAVTLTDEDFAIISRKCLSGEFRFSPYREKLISKGRNKHPRIISMPSMRDKVVLRSITEWLQDAFPHSAKVAKGSQYVAKIMQHLSQEAHQSHWVYRGDIKNFYDDINREQLLTLIGERINDPLFSILIQRALVTPTVPDKTKRRDYYRYRRDKGVPQGLSISNILANLYLHSVDEAMQQLPGILYLRFVDDILMIGDKVAVEAAKLKLEALFQEKQLHLHTQGVDKSSFNAVTDPFGYLGYVFEWPKVSVRESSVERMRNSMLAIIKDAKHKKASDDQLIELLNLRITGAISDKKQYGWLFYYRHINDMALLHQLDAFVLSVVQKHSNLPSERLAEIKRFVRAYYEIKHSVDAGYIHQYKPMELIESLNDLDEIGLTTTKQQATTATDASAESDFKNDSVKPASTEETKVKIQDRRMKVIKAFDEDSYIDDDDGRKLKQTLELIQY